MRRSFSPITDIDRQEVDRHVGARIRERRLLLGLTQRQLGDGIGVTYQQVHKYECAHSATSVGGLYEIAQVLGTSINYFFEGLDGDSEGDPDEKSTHPRERVFLELARNFSRISDFRDQDALSQITRVLAAKQ